MSKVIDVNEGNFDQEIIKAGNLAVVDFGADWCAPCKKLHPIMNEIAEEYGDKIAVGYVDVGESRNVAQRYRVMSVPRLVFFKDGNPVDTIVGLVPKPKIVEKIESYL